MIAFGKPIPRNLSTVSRVDFSCRAGRCGDYNKAMSAAARECYHCKQWIEPGEPHDCWTTTEAALTQEIVDLVDENHAQYLTYRVVPESGVVDLEV